MQRSHIILVDFSYKKDIIKFITVIINFPEATLILMVLNHFENKNARV